MTSLTGRLLARLEAPVRREDVEAARLHLLDWLGCTIAGASTGIGRNMAWAADAVDHPLSVMASGPAQTAFALGSFGSLLEMDDVHRTAILHPGPVVWPAVLACAEDGTADRVAEAALRGYEAMIRLGRAVGQGHYARFHNTATCGGLGSAIAAAWMLELDREQTLWAMAHALSTSGGLWECRNEPGATKHLHVAEAARRGVQAALSARAGIAGPLRILEGEQGFFAGLAPDGVQEALLEGEPWALHETSFKPWPACRHAHPAIDAALALRGGGQVPERIVIETYADAVLFCDGPNPTDPGSARFSLQHAVAVALVDGPPTLGAFEAGALDRPEYVALRDRCELREDPSMTANYPAHFGARLRLIIDGVETTAHVPDAWGDSENPMSAEAVADKFTLLARWAGVEPGPLADAVLQGDIATLRARMSSLPAPAPLKEDA